MQFWHKIWKEVEDEIRKVIVGWIRVLVFIAEIVGLVFAEVFLDILFKKYGWYVGKGNIHYLEKGSKIGIGVAIGYMILKHQLHYFNINLGHIIEYLFVLACEKSRIPVNPAFRSPEAPEVKQEEHENS